MPKYPPKRLKALFLVILVINYHCVNDGINKSCCESLLCVSTIFSHFVFFKTFFFLKTFSTLFHKTTPQNTKRIETCFHHKGHYFFSLISFHNALFSVVFSVHTKRTKHFLFPLFTPFANENNYIVLLLQKRPG